jgi:hypothetical protein
MDFKVHFFKVGLFTLALVIDIVIPSFFPCPPVQPTHHNTYWLTLKVNTHRHQTNHTTYLRHTTTSHNKTCQYHHRRCLFRRCLRARQPPPRAPPPAKPPTTIQRRGISVPCGGTRPSGCTIPGATGHCVLPPGTAGTTTMRTGWPAS